MKFSNLFKKKKEGYFYEDIKRALDNKDKELLQKIWDSPKLYKGYKDEDMSYGYQPTVKEIYATALTNAFTRNVVSAENTFGLFKILIDLGVKIYDKGLLDDEPYAVIEFMLGTDHDEAGEFDKFLDYVIDQIKGFDFKKILSEYKPMWIKEPFLLWLSNHDELDDLKLQFFEKTGNSLLISKEARDIFIF